MTTDLIMGIAAETMKVTLLVSAPVLLVGLVVGLVISVFQAVTQVHEMTLAFVPKIIAVMLALLLDRTVDDGPAGELHPTTLFYEPYRNYVK